VPEAGDLTQSTPPISEVADLAAPSATLVFFLAASCGIIVANIYYSQPLVGLIAPAIGIHKAAASLIVTLTQLGYAAGLLALVPLGDIVENRRLLTLTVAASIPALLIAGLADSGAQFLAASALIGLTSVAVQMLIPLAAHLAPDHQRGRIVGNVMSGLLLGILLARPIASLIADSFGWRMVFFLSAGVMAGLVLVMRVVLPTRQPSANHHYFELLRSLLALPINTPLLRRRAAYQAAAFGAFTLFWTAAPLLLAHKFGFTQRGIAVFAFAGAAGALAAPIAGRLADRNHAVRGPWWRCWPSSPPLCWPPGPAWQAILLSPWQFPGFCWMPACRLIWYLANARFTPSRRSCARASMAYSWRSFSPAAPPLQRWSARC
jgi:predicted MFS family arabinose efflux permease